MNAELTKRLFKAIAIGSDKDMRQVCDKIIDAEREKGHEALALQLDTILRKVKRAAPAQRTVNQVADSLLTLPVNRRNNDQLAATIDHASLRHFMVLPGAVEARFARIEKEYAARERLARHGLAYRKKILLYGAPGNGKTLGAERLAWSTGLPLVKVRFDSLFSSYLGDTASNLRNIFETARQTPCLLFLDECDSIAKSRNYTNDVGEIPRVVNTLLELLENYDAPGLLVAATNLDESLDKALFRRFDDVFEIPLPGPQQILELLKATLSAIDVANDIHWELLVERLTGRSAAEVVKIAQDAAKNTILTGRQTVEQNDIIFAISEIYSKDQV